MNGEGVARVMQEPHPPSLIDGEPPPATPRDPELAGGAEDSKALKAANDPDFAPEVGPFEADNVDGGDARRQVGDSSLLGVRKGEVFGAAEILVVKDEMVLEKDGEGEDGALPVMNAEEEEEEAGLIGGVENSVAIEENGGGRDESGRHRESLPAGEEDRESVVKGEPMEEQFPGEYFVKEASPVGVTANEGKGQFDVGIEKLDEEEEAPNVQESCSIGVQEEKLARDGEAQRHMEQDCEPKIVEETPQVDEKMDGGREIEAGVSQIYSDSLWPHVTQDDTIMNECNTEALDTEIKEVKESEIELEEEETEVEEETKAEANEDAEMEGEEETEFEGEVEKETEEEEAEEEKEMEEEDEEREVAPQSGSGKRKRGRNPKAVARTPPRKTVAEDVCFICFDGGDLVQCDRRGCTKAYHPSCVDLDVDFVQSKGRWNCGWHFCRQCKKNAYCMCYTCQFSLCKGCLKGDSIFICVRGNKGLCDTCMKSIMLIENNEGNDKMDHAAVDDKSSMNYLFKDHWTDQKALLSLTLDEIEQAKNQWRIRNADILAGNPNEGIVSDSLLGNSEEATDSKRNKPKKRRSAAKEVDYDVDGFAAKAEASGSRKKGKRRLKSQSMSAESYSDDSSKDRVGNVPRGRKSKKLSKVRAFEVDSTSIALQSGTEWASKELLEFVVHMKGGDKSPLSQFDVQELLLEYIQRNKLRDPRRKSQIVCDAMLQKLFGKTRVGHFEMLKLLESHFLLKEDSQADDYQGSVVDAEGSQLDADENADSLVDVGKYRGRKARKKGDGRGLQSNLDDYAAVDMQNITLIYLRRNLIEALLEDSEGFHEKVVGSFVRIRIPGSNQKQDIYRLVQVIGTNKVEPYKVGKRIAYCMLEILNLNKTEVVSIDTISNQDFTEDECKRLRQSIKCGLISRLTVGDVLDKAKDLQPVRVNDWLEAEITRLNHLRDRASDLGRKKELRECVEKLQLLNTPEERQRRLDEIPEVNADPNMDPNHESEDESEPEEKGQESNIRPRETSSLWREREHYPSRKVDSASTDPWSPTSKPTTRRWEPSRSLSGKGFSSRLEDPFVVEESLSGNPWSPVRDKVSSQSNSLETFRTVPDSLTGKLGQFSEVRNNSFALSPSETSKPLSSPVQNAVKISDTEKLWHYKDPTGKVQGPFSVSQLRKWNKSGYFPESLGIWRTLQSEDDSILLTDALAGRFEKGPSRMVRKPFETPSHQTYRGQATSMVKHDQNHGTPSTRDTMDQISPTMQRSRSDTCSKGWTTSSVDALEFSHNDSTNQPFTPSQNTSLGWTGRSKVSRWSGSPTPVQLPTSVSGPGSVPGANGMLPSPTPDSNQIARSSNSPFYEQNRGFSRSHLTQQSARDTVGLTQQDERFGSVYAQRLSSQSAATSGSPRVHQTPQLIIDPTTASTSNIHGLSNSAIQPGNGQNPAASSHGWSSGGYMPRPEATNNLNDTNAMHLQGKQSAYAHWPRNPPATNLPPPPTYVAGNPANSGTVPAQNPSVPSPSQAQWTLQVPAAQPNMQWVGMPATQHPSNSNAGWAQVQANPNMSWGAPPGPSPASQFGPQPGPTAPATVVQASGPAPGLQPGNLNRTWSAAGNVNPGWAALPANTSALGPWNWQPPPHGGTGMAPPGHQLPRKYKLCPFLMKGFCKKGKGCDFRHN